MIKVTHASDYIADLPNYVRMKNVSGSWQIKLIDERNISIYSQGHGELSGKIPIWLVNNVQKILPDILNTGLSENINEDTANNLKIRIFQKPIEFKNLLNTINELLTN